MMSSSVSPMPMMPPQQVDIPARCTLRTVRCAPRTYASCRSPDGGAAGVEIVIHPADAGGLELARLLLFHEAEGDAELELPEIPP